MHTPECYKVGDTDADGFQEYSFWVEIGGERHLYQVRARSLDEAFSEVGRNVAYDFEQLRELGSPSAAALVLASLAGGVVLGAMALRKALAYLTAKTSNAASVGKSAQEAKAKAINADETLVSQPKATDQPANAPRMSFAGSEPANPHLSFTSSDPFPWRPVNEFGASGWRAGPVGDNAWRVIVFTDGEADLIRREFAREPDINPQTNVETDGVVVYRFPLATLERVRAIGPGVVEVAISHTRPRGELGFLEVVAQTEEEALRFLIQYFDFIR